jgi:hypothetical protein
MLKKHHKPIKAHCSFTHSFTTNKKNKHHAIESNNNDNTMMLNPPVSPFEEERRGPRRNLVCFALILLYCTMNLTSESRLYFVNIFGKNLVVQTTNTLSAKPTLLLHMGPPKTASSYLQCILTNMIDTLALDNYVFLGVHFDKCKKGTLHQALIADCADIFAQPKLAKFRPEFLNEMRKTHRQGKNAIIINECFKYFTPAQTTLVIDEFSSNWNVKLIMNYRRVYEYLPSSYNQWHKPKRKVHGNPSNTLWPGETNKNKAIVGKPLLPFDIDDRGYHTEVFHNMETKGLHPVSTIFIHSI